jgi:hypothetical protein
LETSESRSEVARNFLNMVLEKVIWTDFCEIKLLRNQEEKENSK